MVSYPKPQIPTQPILSLASFDLLGHYKNSSIPSILDSGQTKFVTSGRVAIALALKEIGIGVGDKVLIPAYHCPAMVEPVIWSGATPQFYKINADTSVNLEDIFSKLDKSVKLLMVTHYFGFPQNLQKIKAFCESRNIYLLEDCAHAFFGEFDRKPLGSYGDYAIASSMKFFPIYEGGCLVSNQKNIKQLELYSAGLSFEIKAALNSLEKAFDYGRLMWLKNVLSVPLKIKNKIWVILKNKNSIKQSIGPGSSDGGFGFEAQWLSKRSSLFSQYLIRFISYQRIIRQRRENYQLLLKAFGDLPECRPLFLNLPDNVVPHVFPLIVNHSSAIFPLLKKAGIPIIRFGEYLWHGVDESTCPVSVYLSHNLLQFPCHQELTSQEIEWMIGEVREIILKNSKTL